MKTKVTKEQWQDFFRTKALKEYLKDDAIAKRYNSVNWILGKEIRLYALDGVCDDALTQAANGIDDLVKELNLDFDITSDNTPAEVQRAVEDSTSPTGYLKVDRLTESLTIQRFWGSGIKEKPYAIVVLLSRRFNRGEHDWGDARFTRGTMILALPNDRQRNREFIRTVAKHEAGHLLGYRGHHGDNPVEVNGYAPVKDCNMQWGCSTRDLCEECKDALVYFWKGVEHRSGTQFVKTPDL